MSSDLSRVFLKSDILEWCTIERKERLRLDCKSIFELAYWIPVDKLSVIRAWVKKEKVKQISAEDSFNVQNFEDAQYNAALNKRDNLFGDLSSFLPSREDQDLRLLSDLILQDWAQREWGHKIESLYLDRKKYLDKVSCGLLRVKDKYLATEIYHRIKSDNISFEELSWQFGQGPERKFGGIYNNVLAESLPQGMLPLLAKLKIGEVVKPHVLGKWFVIVQLKELVPAKFNEDTSNYIMSTEINAWIDCVAKELSTSLE